MSKTLSELTNEKYLCKGLFCKLVKGDPAGSLYPGVPVSSPSNVGDNGYASLLKINTNEVCSLYTLEKAELKIYHPLISFLVPYLSKRAISITWILQLHDHSSWEP